MSWTSGRRDERTNRKFKVWLSLGSETLFAELASTENVSPRGVRVRTALPWKSNTRVFIKPSKGRVWTRARVTYCQKLKGQRHALGLELYEAAHRYNLTFRCIHCGRYEASANFRSDQPQCEDDIKARIYRVQCAGCGWRGEACGFSALRILRYKSVETRRGEESAIPVQPSARVTQNEWPKVLSRGTA